MYKSVGIETCPPHCLNNSHERTEDAGRTNSSLLVQLTSCPAMSLTKAKHTRSERSLSDKPPGSEQQAWAARPKENADSKGRRCSSLLQPASRGCQEVAGGDMGKLEWLLFGGQPPSLKYERKAISQLCIM